MATRRFGRTRHMTTNAILGAFAHSPCDNGDQRLTDNVREQAITEVSS